MAKFTIMESKRSGTCNRCFGPIAVGELIEWNRGEGARHYQATNPTCVDQVAEPEQRAAYLKAVTTAIKAWDGTGSFRPLSFGEFKDSLAQVPAQSAR